MSFIQIIECRTDKPDEVFALDDKWHKATEGKRTARRAVVTRDRDDPARHMIIVFFDSYESAMDNSALPETQDFAAELATLFSDPPKFSNLDIVSDRS